MKYGIAAGVTAGFLLLAPGAAFAAEQPSPSTSTNPPVSTSVTAPPPSNTPTRTPLKPGQIPGTISIGPGGNQPGPGYFVPGQEVSIGGQCWENFRTKPQYTSSLLGTGEFTMVGWDNISVLETKATIPATAKPGTYTVSYTCYGVELTAEFVVKNAPAERAPAKPAPPGKQVAKVPAGAPQTGGSDAPEQDNGPLVAAGAAGVLAAGGAGFALYRRRSVKR
ncbi:hypothetical protein ACFWY9_34920 [Amycolatopsis sp. NPDC059027]|uniref:hypothetical protein n=1 Tax=unclassified Amycolatopsis TaxID=2618356 RepID=UPI00366E3387